MRHRLDYFLPMLAYLGAVFRVFGLLLLLPLLVLVIYREQEPREVSHLCFMAPAALALLLGLLLKGTRRLKPLDSRRSMLLCAVAWIGISGLGALPFSLGVPASYLDAYFEAVSGFTTTGITMFNGLDEMPRSILFWRAFIQWLGGLGILTFFLAVVATGDSAHALFSAESHKIFAKRPAPSLFRTLRILWSIYAGYTVLVAGLLVVWGVGVYDAVVHSFTALSTGGYSPYDASIGYYREAGYVHFRAIENVIILGMLLGGINFFVHYRALTGGIRALWDNMEMKLWWIIVAGATALVAVSHFQRFGLVDVWDAVHCCLFQVVSIVTTTGFATRDIATDYFPPLTAHVFLILMVVGGCVGSTGGGLKVLRIGILFKMIGRQVRHLVHGPSAVNLLTVDGEVIEPEEIRRIGALLFAWIVLLALGGAVTALLSRYGPWESASGMFSALGNIGPCYIPPAEMGALHPIIKLTYIVGMLAGRLEILPILLLLSRRTWR